MGDFQSSNITKLLLGDVTTKLDSILCHPNNLPELTNMITKLNNLKASSKVEALVYYSEHAHRIEELLKERDKRLNSFLNQSPTWNMARKKVTELLNMLNTLGVTLLDMNKKNGYTVENAKYEAQSEARELELSARTSVGECPSISSIEMLMSHKAMMSRMMSEHDEIINQMKQDSESNASKDKAIADLKVQMESMQAKFSELSQQKKNQSESFSSGNEKELHRLNDLVADLNAQLASSSKLQVEVTRLKEDNTRLKSTVDSLQEQLQKEKKENSSLREEAEHAKLYTD